MRTVNTTVAMFPETFLSFWNVRRSHARRRAELMEAWAERSCRASWTPCGLWPSSSHSRSCARKLIWKANLGPHPRPSKSEGETSQDAPAICMHIHVWEAEAREPSSSTASFYRRGKAEGCFRSYRARARTFRPLLLLSGLFLFTLLFCGSTACREHCLFLFATESFNVSTFWIHS